MYIGKSKEAQQMPAEDCAKETIHIPDNYGGNAFSANAHKEELSQEAEVCQKEEEVPKEASKTSECCLPACLCEASEKRAPRLGLNKLFSSDALLILLALLLSGSEDGGEISVLLLLLLLF